MTRIGVRELGRHASRYREQVKAGGVVEVTDRGKLVALLVPPTPAVAAPDRLIAAGRLVPGTVRLFIPPYRRSAPRGASASGVLAELRSDRLE